MARLLAFGLVVAAVANVVTGNHITVPVDLSIERSQAFHCEGKECAETIWCYKSFSRKPLGLAKIWDHVRVELRNSNSESSGWCLLGESNDSTFSWKDFRDGNKKGAVEKRLAERSAREGGGTANVLLTAVDRLKDLGLCKQSLTFSPFGTSCVRVISITPEPKDLKLEFRMELARFFYPQILIAGFLLVLAAPKLSNHSFFYYATGVTLGVVLCVFLSSNYILKKLSNRGRATPVFALLLQGATGITMFTSETLQSVLDTAPEYAVGFLFVLVAISFGFTHYLLSSGPSKGLQDNVRWFIILFGFGLMLFSSASTFWAVTTTGTVFFVLFVYPVLQVVLLWCLPDFLTGQGVQKLRKDQHYLAREYLTNQQFEEEGLHYTTQGISELLESKEFGAWFLENKHRINISKNSESDI